MPAAAAVGLLVVLHGDDTTGKVAAADWQRRQLSGSAAGVVGGAAGRGEVLVRCQRVARAVRNDGETFLCLQANSENS